jgi:sugar phosphate isomerase/epimerase
LSSSNLESLDRFGFETRRVEKPWGHELIWAHTERYVGKLLVIEAGKRLSLQKHLKKDESIFVVRGKLRLVLEDDTGEAPSRDRLAHFVEQAAERASTAGLQLVIENHFHIPCQTLVELAGDYPPDLVAFCVDSANSLRNWESPSAVFDLLEPRAAFYHLKDFRVRGSNVGFEVSGAPLGEGDLDLAWCVSRILARHAHPLVFLENWVPDTGNPAADASNDAEWLARARSALRLAVESSDAVRAEGR